MSDIGVPSRFVNKISKSPQVERTVLEKVKIMSDAEYWNEVIGSPSM